MTSLTVASGTGMSALFAGTKGGGIFRSIDSGSNWTQMLNTNSGFNGLERKVMAVALHQDPGDYDVYFGSDGAGVYAMTNANDSSPQNSAWNVVTGLPTSQSRQIRSLLVLPTYDLLLAGSVIGGGLYKICAPGTGCTSVPSWTQTGSPTVGEAYSLALKPGTDDFVYAGGQQGVYVNPGLMTGGSWTVSPFGAAGQFVKALATSANNPAVVYAGMNSGISPNLTMVYRSSNAGATYSAVTDLPAGTKEVFALLASPTDENQVFAGTDQGVYFSGDAGTTWSNFTAGATAADDLTGVPVESLYLVGSKLYAGTGGKSVYLTTLP